MLVLPYEFLLLLLQLNKLQILVHMLLYLLGGIEGKVTLQLFFDLEIIFSPASMPYRHEIRMVLVRPSQVLSQPLHLFSHRLLCPLHLFQLVVNHCHFVIVDAAYLRFLLLLPLVMNVPLPYPDLLAVAATLHVLLLVVVVLSPAHRLYLFAEQPQLLVEGLLFLGQGLVSRAHLASKLLQLPQNTLRRILHPNQILLTLIIEFQNPPQGLNIMQDIRQFLESTALVFIDSELALFGLRQHLRQLVVERDDSR